MDLLAVTIARPRWQAKRPVGPRPSEAAIPPPFLLACSTAAQGSEWVAWWATTIRPAVRRGSCG